MFRWEHAQGKPVGVGALDKDEVLYCCSPYVARYRWSSLSKTSVDVLERPLL